MIVIISGLYQGEYIITSHFGTQYTMFPMFPMVDINIRLALPHLQGYLSFCKRKRWNQITQLVPGAHFLVARDVLAHVGV